MSETTARETALTTTPIPSVEVIPRADHPKIQIAKDRRLSVAALVCVAFFTTCGGAYGMEPLIAAVGPGRAVALILITPIIWSLPMSLMVAELTTRLPEEGGYYVWVRETLGPFWAVQEACWTIGYTLALQAIFPVLFVSYLTYFVPSLGSGQSEHSALTAILRWLVTVVFIGSAMIVNLKGARDVGRTAKFCAAFVLTAFVAMIVFWLKRGPGPGMALNVVMKDFRVSHPGALLLGLSIIVYNYSGWDNVSTYAEEVDEPKKNYPRAIAMALLLAVLSYLLPVIAGLSTSTSAEIWNSEAGWPVLGRFIQGPWLGALLAAGGLVSMWGLFNAQILYVSRLPFVMAWDGWLPKKFAKVSPTTAVPTFAVVVLCGLTAIFTTLSYGGLAVIQCILYTAALGLEFIALIILRMRGKQVQGSFRIPGGLAGLLYACCAPTVFAGLVLYATLRDWRSFRGQLFVVVGILVSGVVLYVARRQSVRWKTGFSTIRYD